MFHEGIQSGIERALQESRSLVNFIHDDGAESRRFEEWLNSENIPASLEKNAVVLKIAAGSQDYSNITSIFPVESSPAVVVIYQGNVTARLYSGVDRNTFTLQLLSSLRNKAPLAPLASPQAVTSHDTAIPSTSSTSDNVPPSAPAPSTTNGRITESAASASSTNRNLQTLLADRRARLEAEQKAKREAEQARIKAANQRKRDLQSHSSSSTAPSTDSPDSSTPTLTGRDLSERAAETQHIRTLARQKQAAKADRERILQLLEYDKIERAEREAQRRSQAADIASQKAAGSSDDSHSSPLSMTGSTQITLQIRLLSGSTLRQTFPRHATIRKDVRQFLDTRHKELEDSAPGPFTFRQVLTPQPSRTISDAEEDIPLHELCASNRSLSLALVPAPTQPSSAWSRISGSSIPATSSNHGYETNPTGIVRDFLGLVFAYFRICFQILGRIIHATGVSIWGDRSAQGGARGPQNAERGDEASSPNDSDAGYISRGDSTAIRAAMRGNAGMRIRTLRDQRRASEGENDETFYNGNQLSFEHRRNDDDSDA